MELRRADLDATAFGLALAALSAASLAFVAARNGAALVMCGLCLAGLVAGRLLGVSGGVLLLLALGLSAILWVVWIDPLAGPRKTSAIAHFAGGGLIGWALAATLRRRRWPAWVPAALIAVVAVTFVWEIGEWLGDRALDTALTASRRDSAVDVFFGSFGGAIGVGIALLVARRRADG